MDLCSIASGSSGNCIYMGNDDTHILIDAGISGKRIENGLNEIGLKADEIQAILVTHEHSDHVQGLGVLARRYGIPIYGTAGTIEAIKRISTLGKIDESLFHSFDADEDFCIQSMKIHPIHVSHDAADPVAYRAYSGEKSIAVMTDLGFFDDYIVQNLQGLDALLLESNHDVRMLEVGRYTYPLKQRILGNRGHLSNENAGRLLGKVLHDRMKAVFLGHLSQENNLPELAYETVRLEVDMGENPYKAMDFDITVAKRHEQSKMVTI